MYKILLVLAISLLFSACSNKNSAFRYFDKSDIQTQSVQSTKKVNIVKANEVDVVFWATYLNKLEKYKKSEDEEFIVSLYFPNSDEQTLAQKNYTLSLNGESPILLERIYSDDKRFSELLLKNHWGSFYLVKFIEVKDSYKLKLALEINSSFAKLEFEK